MEQEFLDPLSRLALQVFRAQQSLSTAGDDLAAQWGMTSAKWKVLGAVDLSAKPPSASGMGRIMGLTRQATIKQVRLLVEQGLLLEQDDPLDARASVFSLSPQGKTVYDAISAKWAEHVKTLLAALDVAELDAARHLLEALVFQLEKFPVPPVSTVAKPKNHTGASQ